MTSCIALCSTGILRAKLRICVSRRLCLVSWLGGISNVFVDVELECTTSSSFKFTGLPTKIWSPPRFIVFVLSNWHSVLPIEYLFFHCLLIVFSGEHNNSIVLDNALCHWYSPSLYFANSFLHKIKLNF